MIIVKKVLALPIDENFFNDHTRLVSALADTLIQVQACETASCDEVFEGLHIVLVGLNNIDIESAIMIIVSAHEL